MLIDIPQEQPEYGKPIFCPPIISTNNLEIDGFLVKALSQFREEVCLFSKRNDDYGILHYSNEQTLAALFVNGLIRKDTDGEITSLQEYVLTHATTNKPLRPDIFLRVADKAFWIECKIQKLACIQSNHWDIDNWLTFDQDIYNQAINYYNTESAFINKSFKGGHFVMTLVFKIIEEIPESFIKSATENLVPKINDISSRAWFYSVFFIHLNDSLKQVGVEVYGTVKKMS